MSDYQFWSEPVYDRAQSDINNKTLKSWLNASDLNRIEGNIGAISRDFVIPLSTRQWSREDFLHAEDIERIILNAKKIKQALNISTEPFSTVLFWKDLNTIERLLQSARDAFLMLIDWDCFECQFDTWDDFESKAHSWDSYESQIGCRNNKTWNWFENTFTDWDAAEYTITNWTDLDCPNKGGI